eukprot:CAMPEP_0182463256 /NCGR_PEP_ID=MMETSP1319-20130603/7238_1 /TAXON_ID=172717 /ORGANISM="Bolidomonas pacifica, Strain RCC208" /LENGTH=84 /DNA_ID=CAMNT_0024662775 /DNA_START=22 /DNA_END=276 /DNA_ORIENTATION=+
MTHQQTGDQLVIRVAHGMKLGKHRTASLDLRWFHDFQQHWKALSKSTTLPRSLKMPTTKAQACNRRRSHLERDRHFRTRFSSRH